MHELGVVFHCIKEINEIAAEQKIDRISAVTIRLGEVSMVLPDLFEDCWNWAVKKETVLKDAKVKIETIPAITHCEGCGRDYPTVAHGKICPHCGSDNTYLITGNELIIESIEAAMNITEFLEEHKLNPSLIIPETASDQMASNMRSALAGKIIDLPMIPTYLRTEGTLRPGQKAVVIDAGGTNYRCGLAEWTGESFELSRLFRTTMPGVGKPATWEEFITFIADSIQPLLGEANAIGFCFSYSATITPELDGRVHVIDKEVVITGCEGKLIGESLLGELANRGITGKKCVILNDTVAALFGNPAAFDKSRYSGGIGMICGTGINTCAGFDGMIVNLESGMYSGMIRGDIDEEIDRTSNKPGEKWMEKMCSGAYIGQIAKLALHLDGNPNGATVDEFANREDGSFESDVCKAILERSARCMATNILAILKCNGTGKDKPVCVCAEGSLIEKSRLFLPYLEAALKEFSEDYKAEILVGHGSTLPGSAMAALLNTPETK